MTIQELIPLYLKHLKTLGRSFYTIKGTRSALKNFSQFLEEEKIRTIEELTLDVLEEYQEDLAFRITNKGTLLASRTQAQILGVVKTFTRFLKEKDYLLHDPGEAIKLPKKPKRLPKVILNTNEVKKLIEAPDSRTNQGYRNRIILEILYDTAIRRSEIANIKTTDLDLGNGYIKVNGKGNKDRVVPLSTRVCELVNNYILAVRPSFVNGEDPGYLILNRWGQKMDHTFRHTCATHMLKNGAPVRHLQEMLGHESLESTQIYTHVTINDLKEVHARYHPSETMRKD